ncbi:MAG: cupin domain-containing protein [Cyanobacteriota bacterium]|nr:cupin domain-containing protein [Cyanobacteriota bacterium]
MLLLSRRPTWATLAATCAVVGGGLVLELSLRAQPQPSSSDPAAAAADWKHKGVRVISGKQLIPTTGYSTAGMDRSTAIDMARVGAKKIWAGTVRIQAGAKTGAHHHGHLESVIYVVRGQARLRWGTHLEYTADAGPGDFIFVPPYVPHQELNASANEPLDCVLVRSDGEAISINLPGLQVIDPPEKVLWLDPLHPSGGR